MKNNKYIKYLFPIICILESPVSVYASDHFQVGLDGDKIQIGIQGSADIEGNVYAKVFEEYKSIGAGILGICTITALICLLIQIAKLGAAGSNDRQRSSAIKGIFVTGTVLSIFGALDLVVAFFWNAFI